MLFQGYLYPAHARYISPVMVTGKTRRQKRVILTPALFPLRQENADTLARLSQEASDIIGRRIGAAAVVRALVNYAERQGPAWAREHLFPLIEAELQAGVRWGGKKEVKPKRREP